LTVAATVARVAAAVLAASLVAACARRESLEVARDRTTESAFKQEIADLQALIARAESGRLVTQDRLAIGIAERTASALLDASLPQEQVLSDRVRVRIERAQPFFRGNNALLVIQATARGVTTGAAARLEMGGRFVKFRIERGRLTAAVEIVHLKVLGESGLGDALEGLLRRNLDVLSRLIPGLEIPVRLEPSVDIDGLDGGVVVAQAGRLPLQITLAEVIPVDERLWVLVDVKAGPWQKRPATARSE
jgi:hypothetical protein